MNHRNSIPQNWPRSEPPRSPSEFATCHWSSGPHCFAWNSFFSIRNPPSFLFPAFCIFHPAWMLLTAVICSFMCSHRSFRCAWLHSNVVPDVKVPGWQHQNTEGQCNYCLCCKRIGFVWPFALYTQPSWTLMAHWVPSYHSTPLSCL